MAIIAAVAVSGIAGSVWRGGRPAEQKKARAQLGSRSWSSPGLCGSPGCLRSAFFLFALLRGLAGPGTRLMRLLRRAGLVRTGLRRCRTALSANWRRSHPLRFVTGRGSAAGWCRTGHWLRAGLFRHMPRLLRSARRRGAAGMLRTATRGLLWSPGRPGSRSILLRQIGCRRGGPAVLFRRLARRGTPLPGLALARRACLGLARLSRWFCRFLGRCWLVLLGRSRRRRGRGGAPCD